MLFYSPYLWAMIVIDGRQNSVNGAVKNKPKEEIIPRNKWPWVMHLRVLRGVQP